MDKAYHRQGHFYSGFERFVCPRKRRTGRPWAGRLGRPKDRSDRLLLVTLDGGAMRWLYWAQMGPIIELIRERGLVTVVTAPVEERLFDWAMAVAKGGIKLLGIPVTYPGVTEVASDLADEANLIVGVTGVVVPEHIAVALAAGAHFVVSPISTPELIKSAKDRGVVVIAGAATPTEVARCAMEGPDLIAVNPAAAMGGPAYVKQLSRQMEHLPLAVTGGVDVDTAPSYLEAGAVAAIVDTGLFPQDEDPSATEVITMRALALTEVCADARGELDRQSMTEILRSELPNG